VVLYPEKRKTEEKTDRITIPNFTEKNPYQGQRSELGGDLLLRQLSLGSEEYGALRGEG